MKTTKKCCQTICMNCKNYYDSPRLINYCTIVKGQVQNCVTGKIEEVHYTCEELNNGHCRYYKENLEAVACEALKDAIVVYLNVHLPLYSRYIKVQNCVTGKIEESDDCDDEDDCNTDTTSIFNYIFKKRNKNGKNRNNGRRSESIARPNE